MTNRMKYNTLARSQMLISIPMHGPASSNARDIAFSLSVQKQSAESQPP